METTMRPLHYVRVGLLGAVVFGLTAPVVYTQQTTGTPGSPDATTTIKGNQLPRPA
jgi:hypothetical protein